LKAKLMDAVRGSRDPLVMPNGTSLAPFQSTPDQSKLIEVLTQSTNDVATFFNMPPELVGGETGSAMTYNTTEGQYLRVLQFGVRYWMTKLERALSRAVAPQAIFAKFDENDFVRTDMKTRFDSIVAATGGPFLTPDEGREMDDRAPIAGGDVMRETGTQRDLSIAEAIQKVYLGVGVVITEDEAREIVNQYGGNLPIPGPSMGAP